MMRISVLVGKCFQTLGILIKNTEFWAREWQGQGLPKEDSKWFLHHQLLRESVPRQVDKKSRGPHGEGFGILKKE